MKKLLLLPLTLNLIACGGGASSEDDVNTDPDKTIPTDRLSFRDCSNDQSGLTYTPLPEYPGNVSAYNEPIEEPGSPIGFLPESFVDLAAGGILIGIGASEEGLYHQGPQWTIVDEDLTTQINYAEIDNTETWTITKNGMDSDGTSYSNHTHMTIEQTASCGLNILQYEDNGDLSGHYESTTYEWTWKSYENGTLGGLIGTNINQDRSGKTISEDFSDTKSDYPVTIITWDSDGENVLLKTCKTDAGTDCQVVVTP